MYREAQIIDIPQIQIVRNSVHENTLSNPNLVNDSDCESFITQRGKGWVCETNNRIVGFAIADLVENNIWALFIHPEFENQGIGKTLLNLMLDWYFSKTSDTVWLGTGFNTRAEKFYKLQGWIEAGTHGAKEIKFEMTKEVWHKKKS
jgi:GNAT superfamily N-acetyltransferase